MNEKTLDERWSLVIMSLVGGIGLKLGFGEGSRHPTQRGPVGGEATPSWSGIGFPFGFGVGSRHRQQRHELYHVVLPRQKGLDLCLVFWVFRL